MTASLYVERPERVWDDDGDPWTLAEDGRYSLGLEVRKHGETTLGHVQRNYGLSHVNN